MNKAYDVKELLNVLKGKGLDVAEESANIVLEAVIEWLGESARLSANIYDDLMLVALPKIEELAKEQIDKIDGEVG